MYDTIIIGSGPAGLTAGIYASRRQMKTLIIGKMIGGQMAWAHTIENYPGFKSISNFELISKMEEQVKSLGVEIKSDEVIAVKKYQGSFVVETTKGKFQGKTIIIAMGLSPAKLNLANEKEFTGKGISYCANCDGPLYKNKIVAIVGGGNAALDAAEVLSKIAKKVYLVHRKNHFRGFEILADKIKNNPNIIKMMESEITQIIGKEKLEEIIIANINSKEEQMIKVDGLFIEIGHIADTALAADLVKRDEKNQIIIDEKCQTDLPGLFAAGDVTSRGYKQIVIACGQGAIAALSAYKYLQLKK